MAAKRRKQSSHQIPDFGHRLTEIRKSRNVTQVELAEHLGITQANVSLYERGEVRIPSDLVVKIARFLHVSSDELLGLQPIAQKPAMKDRRFLRRLEQIDQLPKRDRDAILRLINAVLAKPPGSRAHGTGDLSSRQ